MRTGDSIPKTHGAAGAVKNIKVRLGYLFICFPSYDILFIPYGYGYKEVAPKNK